MLLKVTLKYTVPEIVNVNREISKLKVDFKGNHKLRIKIKKLKELFSINKVITLLKFKSAVNLQCF